jgi:hypothetical protein
MKEAERREAAAYERELAEIAAATAEGGVTDNSAAEISSDVSPKKRRRPEVIEIVELSF